MQKGLVKTIIPTKFFEIFANLMRIVNFPQKFKKNNRIRDKDIELHMQI